MGTNLKLDCVRNAADKVRRDLANLGVSIRTASKLLGMSNSTLHAFLCAEYNNPHQSTLEKLLLATVWEADTLAALEVLANFDELVFAGSLRKPRSAA